METKGDIHLCIYPSMSPKYVSNVQETCLSIVSVMSPYVSMSPIGDLKGIVEPCFSSFSTVSRQKRTPFMDVCFESVLCDLCRFSSWKGCDFGQKKTPRLKGVRHGLVYVRTLGVPLVGFAFPSLPGLSPLLAFWSLRPVPLSVSSRH